MCIVSFVVLGNHIIGCFCVVWFSVEAGIVSKSEAAKGWLECPHEKGGEDLESSTGNGIDVLSGQCHGPGGGPSAS